MDELNTTTSPTTDEASTEPAQMYVGTKRVLARPMSRAEYNAYRGWELPADENGADEGMLVEYVDGGKANDPRHAGYISWSPLDVFQRAYRQGDSDASLVLRLFGVNPAKYTLPGGALDRALLEADMAAYRSLFANRVQHGTFA